MSFYTNFIQALIFIWDRVSPSFFSCLEWTSSFCDILLRHPPITGILPLHPSIASFRYRHPSITSFSIILPLHPSVASFRYRPSSMSSFRSILPWYPYPSTPSYFILFSHLIQRVLNLPFSPTRILIISIHLDISFILLTFFIFQFPPTYYNKKL